MGDPNASEAARALFGGGPSPLVEALLTGYEAHLGRRPAPEDLFALLDLWDEARKLLARQAGIVHRSPTKARSAQPWCPGSRQLVLSTAKPPFVCPFCGATVPARYMARGHRQLAKHVAAGQTGQPLPPKAPRAKRSARST
jgi:hypothetical protein